MRDTILVTGGFRAIGTATCWKARQLDSAAVNYSSVKSTANALVEALSADGIQAQKFQANVSLSSGSDQPIKFF